MRRLFIILLIFSSLLINGHSFIQAENLPKEDNEDIMIPYTGLNIEETEYIDIDEKSLKYGLAIRSVDKDSPAEKQGIRNDKIRLLKKINNEDCKSIKDFIRILSKNKPGDTIILQYLVSDYSPILAFSEPKYAKGNMILGEDSYDKNKIVSTSSFNKESAMPYIGISYKEVNYTVNRKKDKGLLISKVAYESPAEFAGLLEDDIIVYVKGLEDISKEEFKKFMLQQKIGSYVEIKLSRITEIIEDDVKEKEVRIRQGYINTKKVLVVKNPLNKPVIVNTKSGLIHRRYCNHLPLDKYSKEIKSAFEAEKEGYKYCPLCYRPQFEEEEDESLGIEMALGRGAVLKTESDYVLCKDEAINAWVLDVSNKVVKSNNSKNIKFNVKVVESIEINAWACSPCPEANIYITTGLLSILETDEELASVIAHEMVHINKRHGLQTYKRLEREAFISSIIQAIAVGVAANNRKYEPVIAGAADLLQLTNILPAYLLDWTARYM